MITTLLMLAAVGAPGGDVKREFVASGATAKVGGYRPIRATLDGQAGDSQEGTGRIESSEVRTF